ncbi:PatA/PatG family cyanobactin maturation protease [Thalassotalea ganghwensis]
MAKNNALVNTNTIALESLQQLGSLGKDIKVGVVDGGIDCNHPLLSHLQISQPLDAQHTKHGTSVCSLIVGKSIGIAPQAEIHSFPVFSEDVNGHIHGCSERQLAKAITQANNAGCNIINISGASLSLNGIGSDELRQAIRHCCHNKVLIIAAVGNDGQKSESIPASLHHVLAVGACDTNGKPANFNNVGPKLRKKMLLASGVDMPVAFPESDLAIVSGSSFATPIVSGIAALLIATLRRKTNALPTIETLERLLFNSATQIASTAYEKNNSFFRLNIPALLELVKQDVFTVTPQINKRTNTMSKTTTEPAIDSETSIVPSEASIECAEIPESELSPSSSTPIEPEQISASSLSLPQISDPAANNHVHITQSKVTPQSAMDARNAKYAEKVFLIGTIGYDFGTEARLDYFTQVMGNQKGHPFDPVQMASHLNEGDNAEESNALIWTLKIDGIPVYAIEPDNQFAVLQYARLVEFLNDQENAGVERVSIAGIITGETRLFNGHVIPTISPILRGMFNWKSKELAQLVMGTAATNSPQSAQLTNFLNRIYYELRNRGAASHERAINYAATNAYQMKEIFDDAFKENLFLNKISATESPVSRPESDCWDVILEFFNPSERLTAARKLYRYTIDVSDLMPVTIGTLRSWHAY